MATRAGRIFRGCLTDSQRDEMLFQIMERLDAMHLHLTKLETQKKRAPKQPKQVPLLPQPEEVLNIHNDDIESHGTVEDITKKIEVEDPTCLIDAALEKNEVKPLSLSPETEQHILVDCGNQTEEFATDNDSGNTSVTSLTLVPHLHLYKDGWGGDTSLTIYRCAAISKCSEERIVMKPKNANLSNIIVGNSKDSVTRRFQISKLLALTFCKWRRLNNKSGHIYKVYHKPQKKGLSVHMS